MSDMDGVWVWVKVPLRALYAAITALKDLAMRQHTRAAQADDAEEARHMRLQADQTEAHSESLRQALRKVERGDDPDPR